jgi:hypothetical protein
LASTKAKSEREELKLPPGRQGGRNGPLPVVVARPWATTKHPAALQLLFSFCLLLEQYLYLFLLFSKNIFIEYAPSHRLNGHEQTFA